MAINLQKGQRVTLDNGPEACLGWTGLADQSI